LQKEYPRLGLALSLRPGQELKREVRRGDFRKLGSLAVDDQELEEQSAAR
jgi:hypothetical protein